MQLTSRDPKKIALAWRQQAEHIVQLRSWFRRKRYPTAWESRTVFDPDCELCWQLIQREQFELITVPWQMIPMLDNHSPNSPFCDSMEELAQHLHTQDRETGRTRPYTLQQMAEWIETGTVEPPTVYWEWQFSKPQFILIDGRTRLTLSYAMRQDCVIAITDLQA